MSGAASLMKPTRVPVSRSEFRDNQKEFLKKAKGHNVLVITGDAGEEKLVLDKKYFDEILGRLKAYVETLEVAMDKKLMSSILAASQTLEEDVRTGKLLSMDEMFSED